MAARQRKYRGETNAGKPGAAKTSAVRGKATGGNVAHLMSCVAARNNACARFNSGKRSRMRGDVNVCMSHAARGAANIKHHRSEKAAYARRQQNSISWQQQRMSISGVAAWQHGVIIGSKTVA